MKLSFHGACRSVTGSCFLVETQRTRVLVDCGMVQGSKTEKELNYRAFPFDPHRIDSVVLTHAHIDHSGLLPKLTKLGFDGPIYATRATTDLCSIMLQDSARIQESEVAQLNARNARRGVNKDVEPIYTVDDAQICLTQFRPSAYNAWTQIAEDVRIRFWNAGHLLGSASVEMEAQDGEQDGESVTRLLFSGDIGPDGKLLQHDPDGPAGVDHVVCEATYGDTERPAMTDAGRRALLLEEVTTAAGKGGALLIPSFAVERTQELLTDLVSLITARDMPAFPIFIDSPMADKASDVFAAHASELDNGRALTQAMTFHSVRFTPGVEQSKAINRLRGFHVVIAASGMCEAGRIRHHLKQWLWRRDATVLLVGFQAQGTLGRILLEGARRVRIMGEEIDVRASIRRLDIYSGHADGPALERWIDERAPVTGNVFLVHGEERAMAGLQARIAKSFAPENIISPALDEAWTLEGGAARIAEGGPPPRLSPESLGRVDWHNDLSKLILDINDAIRAEADERNRAKLVRKLRRVLEEET
ncbi:MAG: MBL fold metallo-hydrolase [Beijerinckiaceae bacterium]|nr:MBL fold metallo-hydrolase [Beijerinckiaceae bacterium]